MTGPIKLFATKDRAESHAKLDEILAAGEYPTACCRERENDPNEPYTVWSTSELPAEWAE